MPNPSRERILGLVRKSAANHAHFFDNLDDPAWLGFLTEAGFFTKPPAPIRSDGWVQFPNWPESRYLARVAALAPEAVAKVFADMQVSDNVRVHEDVLRAAAQMPGPLASDLARQEAEWLRGYEGHLMSLPGAGGELLAHLAREGEVDAAFDFARTLLAILPAEREASDRRRARARMEDYSYGRILETAWPAAVGADPVGAFAFLCDRLEDIVRIGFTRPDRGDDFTYIWRPAIEDHTQNLGHSLFDTMVDAVRDHASEAAATPEGLDRVLTELEGRPERIFRRITLYLLRVRGTVEQVGAMLTDEDLVGEVVVWHEYGELLRERFGNLGSAERDQILQMIARGPELELTATHEERGVTSDDLQRREDHWRLRRYALIASHLEDEALQTYQRLRGQYAEPEHPTFLTYTSSWTGPTSPVTADELTSLGPQGVARMLQDWCPSGNPTDPSPEGVGRILRQVVAANADDFAAAAARFAGLDPTYVRSVLGGLADAAKAGTALSWEPVLELCQWVVAQPRSPSDPNYEGEADPHWGWARKQIADLLTNGFADTRAQIPIAERQRVWELLTTLTDDPDPTPEHEERFGGDNMDPATLSVNTTRGEAMHAVVRYAFWVEQALDDVDAFDGIVSLPEVQMMLELHLDPDVDSSLAVRSVYGQWFPQFVRIDNEWATGLAARVFPTAPELGPFFHAAWNAYIVFNRAYVDVFGALGDAYAMAVMRLADSSGHASSLGDPRERLGEHVLAYRVLGATSGHDDDLFARFWKAAAPALRREVLTRVGWSLEHAPELDDEEKQRFVATWEWILSVAGAEVEPLSGFGSWLGASALDGGWLLAQAQAVLDVGVHLEPDFVVYEALRRLAADYPGDVVQVLRRMVETDAEGWSVEGSSDEVREALEIVLAADDTDTRRRAEALVHLLGASGMNAFGDLLAPE